MSDYSLKVENLTKKYDDFLLDKVSFFVPKKIKNFSKKNFN